MKIFEKKDTEKQENNGKTRIYNLIILDKSGRWSGVVSD